MTSLKLKIQTNFPVSRVVETAIIGEVTTLLSHDMPFSNESVTSSVEANPRLILADSHSPGVFVEVRSAQLPPQGRMLGQALAALIQQHLSVPPGRVYVKFVSSSSESQRRPATP